jgi:catechol 2,3-dioxygenase-like lactoylglutathione lyase family enzyme
MNDLENAFLGIDHITIPVGDLAVAERFYIDVLGGVVTAKIDEAALRMRRPDTPIDPRALHTSITFGGDTRLDPFPQSEGQPPAHAGHPHIAIRVRPQALLDLVEHLHRHGVPTQGPNRLGPPGQASVYFNDPFGNHLEFQTLGYDGQVTLGPPDTRALVYSWSG